MTTPKIPELCAGEINDFVLGLVESARQNIPPDVHCRRREICDAILACNSEVGERSKMKDGMTTILKSWNASPGQVRKLERLGFRITTGKTHWKMRWGDSAYYATLGATPSDRHAGTNAARNAVAAFF